MPVITLPDGSQRSFDNSVSVADVAADIGPGLAKAAIAGEVGGQLVDTSYVLSDDADLSIVTAKSEQGLDVIRHSTAHLLAQAVKQLFPMMQVTIGPVIDDGYFYDFAGDHHFSPDDLEVLEKRMGELVEQAIAVSREEMDRDDAVEYFNELGEAYKAEIISDIPAGQTISLYRQGDFVDLCRGPHVPNTSHLKAFKLTKLAGAYWRGDSSNEMLQRIYGTAWGDKKALKAYLRRLEEAEKRDHRKTAKKMDLFHVQEEAPGMVFWHANGWTLYQQVEQYMRQVFVDNDYREIRTPQLVDLSLWEKSGHADKFGDDMFATHSENRDYAIKPMNCPCHVQVFNQGLRSYRDLPLRLAEFGSCHRNEPSGTLHGLMRVRNFVQDDAHIFCTEEQIQDEVAAFIDLLYSVYADFGFSEVIIMLSTRPEKRVGSDQVWDKAELALEQALNSKKLDWTLQPGEGAFYGPKIEFSLQDCIGRVWQCGTIQVDFSMPERLGAQYVAEDGGRQTPVMLHRAILGSLERFIGILLEQYADGLPLWLAPMQAVVMGVSDKHADYVKKVTDQLLKYGIRTHSDLRNEKIGYKIREHTIKRVPFLLILGDRECENRTVAVRSRSGVDLGELNIDDFISRVTEEVKHRTLLETAAE